MISHKHQVLMRASYDTCLLYDSAYCWIEFYRRCNKCENVQIRLSLSVDQPAGPPRPKQTPGNSVAKRESWKNWTKLNPTLRSQNALQRQ